MVETENPAETQNEKAAVPLARASRRRSALSSTVNTPDRTRGRRWRGRLPEAEGERRSYEGSSYRRPVAPSRSAHTDRVTGTTLARRGLLATDIVDYGRRTAPEQEELQRTYLAAIQHAAAAARLDVDWWLRQMTGDGELAILPEGVHEPAVLATLLPALTSWLDRYNRPRLPEHRLRLRVALHHGLIHLGSAVGFAGRPAVTVARLLASTALRGMMCSQPDVSVAVAISVRLYREIVLNRYLGLRPKDFRQAVAWVPDKGFAANAWLYLPEYADARPLHDREIPRVAYP